MSKQVKPLKKYYIHVSYQTGDSFKHYDTSTNIELQWDNLDIAKQNLQRIKEHYAWYDTNHGNGSYYIKDEDKAPKPDFVNNDKYSFRLNLLLDDGSEMIYSASAWCGYF